MILTQMSLVEFIRNFTVKIERERRIDNEGRDARGNVYIRHSKLIRDGVYVIDYLLDIISSCFLFFFFPRKT